jgi:hypothetical protein
MKIETRVLIGIVASLLPGLHAEDSTRPEDRVLSEWFEVPLKEATAVLGDRESHNASFNWEVVQKGDKATARISGDFSAFEWPKKQMDLSSKNPNFKFPYRLQRVEDGWLAGYNGGEFGAELWWFSPDGSRSYKVSDHQINQFLAVNDVVLAAEGLSHLSTSEGSIIRLSKKDGKWRTEVVAKPDFGEPSGLVQIEDGTFIALSGFECWTISANGALKSHEALSKISLPPYFSTAAREGSTIYLGSEYFVMAIDLKTLKLRYLVPTEGHWRKIKDAYKPFKPFGD